MSVTNPETEITYSDVEMIRSHVFNVVMNCDECMRGKDNFLDLTQLLSETPSEDSEMKTA